MQLPYVILILLIYFLEGVLPPPPFFLFLEIHNHILINLPKIGLETPLTMAKKNLGLSNIKQTNNNRTAILSI